MPRPAKNPSRLTARATRRMRIVLAVLSAGAAAADARLSLAAEKGTITGTVASRADKVTKVIAVQRNGNRRFPGRIDVATGRFTIPDLPLPGRFDCILEFGKARLEGADMKVPRSDYEEEQPLSAEDVKTIAAKAKSMNQFEDVVEILGISGNIQHAAVLLNKLKTKPFYGSKPGEAIWRAEVWLFERPEETWAKVQDELFTILYRVRLQKSVYDNQSITFDPLLGGLELTPQEPALDVDSIKPPPEKPGVRLRNGEEEKEDKK